MQEQFKSNEHANKIPARKADTHANYIRVIRVFEGTTFKDFLARIALVPSFDFLNNQRTNVFHISQRFENNGLTQGLTNS